MEPIVYDEAEQKLVVPCGRCGSTQTKRDSSVVVLVGYSAVMFYKCESCKAITQVEYVSPRRTIWWRADKGTHVWE